MFWHNFKYSFKSLIRTKVLIFWTIAFPLILATFFNLAFSDLEKGEVLDIVDLAVVDDENFKNNIAYVKALEILGDENEEDRLFNIDYVSEDQAKDLLKDKKVAGYVKFEGENPKLMITRNGIDQTVINYALEEIGQFDDVMTQQIGREIAGMDQVPSQEKIQAMASDLYEELAAKKAGQDFKEDKSPENLSVSMLYFYSDFAMTAMYGSMLVLEVMTKNLPDMSKEGMRVAVSPSPRWKLILSSLLSSFVVQVFSLLIFFLYTSLVLKVDYGDKLPMIGLLALVGSIAGSSLGIFVGSIIKAKERTKISIILAITMTGSFLAGMMGEGMKFFIDLYLPLLNKINPVRMITDGLYSLYYYEGLDRYFTNLVSLVVFIVILLSLSSLALRRKRYDSI